MQRIPKKIQLKLWSSGQFRVTHLEARDHKDFTDKDLVGKEAFTVVNDAFRYVAA